MRRVRRAARRPLVRGAGLLVLIRAAFEVPTLKFALCFFLSLRPCNVFIELLAFLAFFCGQFAAFVSLPLTEHRREFDAAIVAIGRRPTSFVELTTFVRVMQRIVHRVCGCFLFSFFPGS